MLSCILLHDNQLSVTRASKVRGALLPQEYSLYQLIQNTTNTHVSWSASTVACEWDGAYCIDDKVVRLNWSGRGIRGTLRWEHLPSTLLFFDAGEDSDFPTFGNFYMHDVICNSLCGELPFEVLPKSLEYLYVGRNKLIGSFNGKDLPHHLVELYLHDNEFDGTIHFPSLPQTLTVLCVSKNQYMSGVYVASQNRNLTLIWDQTLIELRA